MWVIPAPFYATRNIRDLRYPPGDEESRERRRLCARKSHVVFRRVALRSTADYRMRKMLHAATLRNSKVGKELLVAYGLKYLF